MILCWVINKREATSVDHSIVTEVRIYKRKHKSKKTSEHAFDQESDQEKMK